ncbi:alpha/beta fold hydrolase [uncultured Gilliamella sp.]|uniref:thioesterase II family protein n=1 Tax=uncultured Gilliamella sp. TaxID=1193505 RepID=UPI0025FBF4AE|nr:alpha/beta fold hydrolase [uncultured Gilliamella sp.]
MSNISLYCLPYSGGSASIYYKWHTKLADNITLVPLEPAGRGTRISQPLCQTIEDAIQDFYQQFITRYDGGDYVIFGHSLGGLMAFELVHYILDQGYAMPKAIFFSGARPPDRVHDEKILHTLSDTDFITEIAKLGGTSVEVLRNKELMNIFTPIIKNDYRLYEQYSFQPKSRVLTCPIIILHGDADSLVALEELPRWEKFTDKEIKIITFPEGDHFFVDKKYEQLVNIINQTIKDVTQRKE